MIQVEYKFKLGADEFTIKAEVQSQKEFFEAMAFYANLPKVGPNGETDLKLTYRCVQEYEYYSIVSQLAGKEYRLGQYKGADGELFGKGWEALYQKDGEQTQDETEKSSGSRFSKPEKTESKPTSRFSKPAAKQEETEEAETTEEESQEESTEAEEQQAPAKEAPKQETKAPAAPAGKSKMADLMAKYGSAKSGASTSNIRR